MALIFDSLVLDGLFAFLTLFSLLYLYAVRNFSYWEKRGVPAVKPVPFFGSIPGVLLLREAMGCWLEDKYNDNPGQRFFGAYFMDKPAVVVRDLELVKNVLVKDAHAFLDRIFTPREDLDPLTSKHLFTLKGKKWKHLRVKLSPTFTSGKMKKMFYIVDECGQQLASCLEQSISSGDNVNGKETMARYTMDVIASCAFGVSTNALADPRCEFRSAMKRVFDRDSLVKKITATLIFIRPDLLHLIRMKAVDGDIEDLVRKMFWDVLEERKRTGMVRNDFMDLMIKLRDEGEVRSDDANDLDEINQDNSYGGIDYSKKENINFEMDDDDYVAQAFVFLIASFETASSVLTHTFYELALNQDVQDRLRKEINTTLGKSGGKLTYEDMTGMTYLEMVVSETLRKYPTLSFLDRMCLSDYKIPGSDVTIEKGTPVMIPVLGIQMDPEIYPEPEKYDPERFNAENKSKRSPFAHIPFGEGPRICIGMRFGQMQVKTALIHILSSFQVRPCDGTPKPPLHYRPGSFTHTPIEDVILAFRKLD